MHTVGGNRDFSDWLIRLGDEKLKNFDEPIEIPSKFMIEDSLVDFVYGKNFTFKEVISLSDREILCLKSDTTVEVNEEIINRLEEKSKTY
jgi:hypothetical protein